MQLAIIWLLITFFGPCFTEDWAHSAVLDGDGRYKVYWTVEGDSITFQTEVQAKGYTGLGLSKHGAMGGSDIVTGWVENGVAYFQDRHAVGQNAVVDDSQDWHLLQGSENETHTILKFRRKLITCDQEGDLEIDESTIRLIYAYTDADPISVDKLMYHGGNRGSKSTMLLHPNPLKSLFYIDFPHWEVKAPKVNISSDLRTLYWCSIIKGPEVTQKNHIVRIEPYIHPGSEPYVHHMVMYECLKGSSDKFEPHVGSHGHECYHPNMPDAFVECDGVFAAWGIGGQTVELPEHVGIAIEPEPTKYYMLQIHYDNPFGHGGIVDESGLRLFYTSNLRKYEAGTWMIGSSISDNLIVPPKREKFVVTGHSDPKCLSAEMPDEGVKVFGVLLHSHLLGRRIAVRHFRPDVKTGITTELTPLAVNENFDFNYQEYMFFKKEVTVLPTDQITVECTYNSMERDQATFGGFSTDEEMCLAFFIYYPRLEKFGSLSVALTSLIHGLTGYGMSTKSMHLALSDYDWSRINISNFESATRYSPHSVDCLYGNGTKMMPESVSYPVELIPYKRQDSCTKANPEIQEWIRSSAYRNYNCALWTIVITTMCYFILFYSTK